MRTIGPSYRAERVLSDGTRIVVRPIRRDDSAELRRGFEQMSPESRYCRFFAAVGALSDATIEYLTNVDGENHVALVAAIEPSDRSAETGIGVARFIRLPNDPEVAEAAVAVVDKMQRRGVGCILLTALAEAARERGIRRFRASILATNTVMRHIAAAIGAKVTREDDATLAIEVDLDDAPDDGARELEHVRGSGSPVEVTRERGCIAK